MTSTTVGIACSVPSERAAFVEWLAAVGYQPLSMRDLRALTRYLKQQPIEALVASAEVVSQLGLPTVLKILTPNRPLVVVGRSIVPDESRRRASWLDRPTSADALAIGVALALAECGRTTLRTQERVVPAATVNGVVSQVVDVSDGVRLQLKNDTPSLSRPTSRCGLSVWCSAVVHPISAPARLCCAIQQHLPIKRPPCIPSPLQSPRSSVRVTYWSPRVAKYTTLGAPDRAAAISGRPSRSRSAMSKP